MGNAAGGSEFRTSVQLIEQAAPIGSTLYAQIFFLEETGQGKMEKLEHKDESSAKGRKGEKCSAGRKHQSNCDQRLRYGAQIEIAQSLAAG